jgi:IS5 family transposase
MSRRRLGQEAFGFASRRRQPSAGLDALLELLDWTAVAQQLDDISSAAKCACLASPRLFKGLLISVWYDLSDVQLAEALDDRASFRWFCGFSGNEPTPERTAFVRFRRQLVGRALDNHFSMK